MTSAATSYMPDELEEALVKMLARQRDRIDECTAADEFDEIITAPQYMPPRTRWAEESWLYACQFLAQFGYLGDRKRRLFFPLAKSADLVRDVRLLDKRNVRDYHKIGIIYVGTWQEDKSSIMQNERGSPLFMWFLEQLGWRVELDAHRGYMGGLPKSHAHSSGRYSMYFAAPSVEVMTHVNTMIPLGQQQSSDERQQQHDYTTRMRHIGNDAVIVIWSENWRDYERSTIRTNFADVLICIYPLVDTGLFRVSVVKKPGIPSFGPLQPGSSGGGVEMDMRLVDASVLPALVRATTINASRAIRAAIPNWQWFFEERAVYLSNVISKNTSCDTHAGLLRSLLGLSYAENNNNNTRSVDESDDNSEAANNNAGANADTPTEQKPVGLGDDDAERKNKKRYSKRPRQLSLHHILENLRAHGSATAHTRDRQQQNFFIASTTTSDAEDSLLAGVMRGRSRSEGEVQASSSITTTTTTTTTAQQSTAASAATTTTSYLKELLHAKRRQPPTPGVAPQRVLQSSRTEISAAAAAVTTQAREGVALPSVSEERPWMIGLDTGSIGGGLHALPLSAAAASTNAHSNMQQRSAQALSSAAAPLHAQRDIIVETTANSSGSNSEVELDDDCEEGFDGNYDYTTSAEELPPNPTPTMTATMTNNSHPAFSATSSGFTQRIARAVHRRPRSRAAVAGNDAAMGSGSAASELSDSLSFSSASSSPVPPLLYEGNYR